METDRVVLMASVLWGRVGKVRCVVNSLSGEANKQRASAVEGQEEVVPAGMVLQSIG